MALDAATAIVATVTTVALFGADDIVVVVVFWVELCGDTCCCCINFTLLLVEDVVETSSIAFVGTDVTSMGLVVNCSLPLSRDPVETTYICGC